MHPLFYILFSVTGMVAAQIAIKYGVNMISASSTQSIGAFLLKALTHPFIVGGFAFAFISALTWLLALRALPLSYAYPFTALNLMLVILCSNLIFHEPIPKLYWLSMGLILSGILLLAFSKTPQ